MNVVIGIWLPPFLINELGVDAYGLIPVSMSLTSVMLIITISINGTLSRFLSIDFEDGNLKANKTFNTAFYSMTALVLLLLPLAIFFSFNSEKFLNIPDRLIKDSNWLFFTVLMAFLLNAFSSLFNSIAFVKNRIDLRNSAVIITRIATLAILVLFFNLGIIKIQVFGIATLVATIFGFFYSLYIFKTLSPELEINFHYFDKEQLKEISTLGFWLIVNQIGVLFFLQSDIIIINYFKGAELSGIYATLLQWSFLIRSVVGLHLGL